MTPLPSSALHTSLAPAIAPAADRHVSVIGLGYIGLPTAAMFASRGLRVTGVDVDARVITAVNAGRTHIVEPGLEGLVQAAVADGRLTAVDRPQPADAFLITVPTPVRHDDHQPDLAYVDAATRAIAPVLAAGNLVVLESTSPVGTTRRMAALLATLRPDLRFPGEDGDDGDIDLAYSPERVIPGRTLIELTENSRVVGGVTPRAAARAAALYGTLTRGECLITSDRTAEMVKLVENSFRDVNIAFANELSMICDDLRLDVWEVIGLANRHPRVSILSPGAGVGGHCIAVDPWFVVASDPARALLIRTARNVNDLKPFHVIDRVRAAIGDRPDARIACLGLTFKPDVDDFRESPALLIAQMLAAEFPGRVYAADPYAQALPAKDGTGLTMVEAELALAWADVIVMLVGHRAFRKLACPETKAVVDACGFWVD